MATSELDIQILQNMSATFHENNDEIFQFLKKKKKKISAFEDLSFDSKFWFGSLRQVDNIQSISKKDQATLTQKLRLK